MKNIIVKRLYFAFELKLDSPLCISGGEAVRSDIDIIHNGNGEPFIPGSSVAGAFRNYLKEQHERETVMGFIHYLEDGNNGQMSSLFLSDLYFKKNTVRVDVRDGVRLGADKIVVQGGKYEQEIIETGAETTLFMNCVIRKDKDQIEFENIIKRLLLAVDEGEIRFGSRKNRGFGKMRVNHVYRAEFDASSVEAWLYFEEDPKNLRGYQQLLSLETWINDEKETWNRQYLFLTIPLSLTGGISIRRYSSNSEFADFEHVTCNGCPVIPGSSWNGVIRDTAGRILEELGCIHKNEWINRWFGYVNETGAEQSMVVIGESLLRGAEAVPMTRNRIDRFDASSKNGGLYTEISYFGGTTELRIGVRKNEKYCYQALTGLLLIVMEEIQEGYTPVGGQTAIGRGIFSGNGEIENTDRNQACDFKSALLELIKKEAGV